MRASSPEGKPGRAFWLASLVAFPLLHGVWIVAAANRDWPWPALLAVALLLESAALTRLRALRAMATRRMARWAVTGVLLSLLVVAVVVALLYAALVALIVIACHGDDGGCLS